MVQSKLKNLNNIAQAVIDDNICPELADGATQLVFGTGNPDADMVFVGEAPGKNEDILGRPFVGASGKLLDEMLDSISLSREDVYITNIVKYRPPNNRDPLPEEKQAFWPYLQAQIEVIQPKVIIPLGRHSTNCFLPDLQISQVHGKPKSTAWKNLSPAQNNNANKLPKTVKQQAKKTVVILPLFHPAAALYNGGMRATLFDDFRRIPTILQKVKDLNEKENN